MMESLTGERLGGSSGSLVQEGKPFAEGKLERKRVSLMARQPEVRSNLQGIWDRSTEILSNKAI
jgi:hypothetical protein